jgi:hypothetical protein
MSTGINPPGSRYWSSCTEPHSPRLMRANYQSKESPSTFMQLLTRSMGGRKMRAQLVLENVPGAASNGQT